ncbi:MAG: response regulator [Acaryochloridaceae cyanobacterium RU_4_10]|nr:response regulator [Acaryochloridaceae cyanobacterium RU_4_10]
MKILVVEDDRSLASALQKVLSEQHYLVDVAFDGQTGLELAEAYEYDLIVLDVMLPKQSGIRICQQLRSQRNNVLILLMTVQDESSQKVTGLDAGADDYLTKPIDTPEFLARIRALLRRLGGTGSPILEWHGLQLDPQSCRVSRHDELLSLTAKEYELLELFLRNPKRIFSQSVLVERVWSIEEMPTENAVRAHIKRLRQKLDRVGLQDAIETVYGLGYRLREIEPDESSTSLVQPSNPEMEEIPGIQMSNLWQQYRPEYLERAADLIQTIASLAQAPPDDRLRQQAQAQAHTLAGSLGSFGIETASQLADRIERRLKADMPLNPSELQHLQTLAQTIQTELETATEEISIEILALEQISHTIQLLIVDDDLALASQLATLSEAYGIQTHIETDIVAARAYLTHTQPDVVLIDLGFPDSPNAGFDLLSDFSAQWPHIPAIVFTAHDEFSDRLQSAHLGGRFFLQKPVLPVTVIDTVLQVYAQLNPTDIKLMLIEDDPEILETIQSILSFRGFQLDIVQNVSQGWKNLPIYRPDLLLLSAELPDRSGLDLCQVIRHEPDWSDLPVIFLVANPDPAIVRHLCEVGATACVSKSTMEADLVTRILNCIRRTHRSRNTATPSSAES